VTRGFGTRGQVDLVDLQSLSEFNHGFRYLLTYQDHGIKFYDNRALKSKRHTSIAVALLDIFTLIGAPMYLHTDNGREFVDQAGSGSLVTLTDEDMQGIIAELKQLWPECKMIHGRARHSQSQGDDLS
jgi:hypothetical protein